MTRTKIKGTFVRGASSPETEPDFYSMPWSMYPTDTVSTHEELTSCKSDNSLVSFEGKHFYYLDSMPPIVTSEAQITCQRAPSVRIPQDVSPPKKLSRRPSITVNNFFDENLTDADLDNFFTKLDFPVDISSVDLSSYDDAYFGYLLEKATE